MSFKGERNGMEKDSRLKVFSLQSCVFKLYSSCFPQFLFVCMCSFIHSVHTLHVNFYNLLFLLLMFYYTNFCYYKIFITIIINCLCNTSLYKDTYFITVFSFYWTLETFTFFITINNSFINILCIYL